MKKSALILLFIVSLLFVILFFALSYKYKSSSIASKSGGDIFSSGEDRIGVLEIDGVIGSSDDILKKIRILKKKNEVKSVVVRINSPGGAVAPSQEIYEELKKLDLKKPVVASFSSLAASGAYYIGLGARKIVANSGTLTGSIGVIMNLVDLQDLYKLIKVSPYVIKSGRFKDIGNTNREMTSKEKEILQKMSDDIHFQFKNAVSESRKIPIDSLNNIADGRVFTGDQAFKLGLIDFIGTFDDAINLSANLAKIPTDSQLFYPKAKKESLRSLLYDMESILNIIKSKLSATSTGVINIL